MTTPPEQELRTKLVNAYIATRTPAAPQTPDWGRVRRSLECELFAKAVDAALADSAYQHQAGEAERLIHVIDRDRYVAAACLGAIEKVLDGRRWLAEPGRGSYAYDDERYQQEFGLALDEIREALKPLSKLAKDKSDCATDPEKVQAARTDGAARFAQQSAKTSEGWQPIETAPKDWVPALVYSPSYGEPVIVEKRANNGTLWLGDWDYEVEGVTHWMPLPASPTPVEKDDRRG